MSEYNSHQRNIKPKPGDSGGDQRARLERRCADKGPPTGMRERRRGQDRRALSVSEVLLSDDEWVRYFATMRRG